MQDIAVYAYCHNDPVNKVDVLGLSEEDNVFVQAGSYAAGTILSLVFGSPAHAPGNENILWHEREQLKREDRHRRLLLIGYAQMGQLQLDTAPHYFTREELLAIRPTRTHGPTMQAPTATETDMNRSNPQMSSTTSENLAYASNSSWNLGSPSTDPETAIQRGQVNATLFASGVAWEAGGLAFASLQNSVRLNRAFASRNILYGTRNPNLGGVAGINWTPGGKINSPYPNNQNCVQCVMAVLRNKMPKFFKQKDWVTANGANGIAGKYGITYTANGGKFSPSGTLKHIEQHLGLKQQSKISGNFFVFAKKEGHYIIMNNKHVIYGRVTPRGKVHAYDPQTGSVLTSWDEIKMVMPANGGEIFSYLLR